MSGDASIAAVTSALKSLLQVAIAPVGGRVTSRPPDKARTDAVDQLNVFLYRTAIDAAWRNQPPERLPAGNDAQPALPLVLSYVISAYGQDDDEVRAHGLLGVGMRVLNDNPILSRALLTASIPGTGLDAQAENVRVTPHPIPMDEISRLWTTFQTGYRISATYDVAVVLIDSQRAVKAVPPVLRRGADDRGPDVIGTASPPPLGPTVLAAVPPAGRPSVAAGETLTLAGAGLAGMGSFQITGIRLAEPRTLPATAGTTTSAEVVLPGGADALPAGTYLIGPPGGARTGAAVPLAVRPELRDPSPIRGQITDGSATMTVTSRTPLRAEQVVRLLVSSRIVEPSRIEDGRVTASLTDVTPGTYALRLSVDAVESLFVDPATPDVPASFHQLVLT